MPELLICPRCGSHNYFRPTNKNPRKCYWFMCGHVFSLKDRFKALKKASRKSYRKLALQIGVKQRVFENWTQGKYEPSAENMILINCLFDKYFSKEDANDFIAQ